MQQPAFWVALGKIMWINILLSGDNALVIAMACRGLPPRQRFWGMVLGAGVAVFLRIIFTGIVVSLMALPFLKLVGGLALLYIAAKLLVPEHEGEGDVDAAAHLWAAVQIVAIADIVMSLDNVIAVAAAANGSIPAAGDRPCDQRSADRRRRGADHGAAHAHAALVWAGAALLGWVAGEVMATDPAIVPYLKPSSTARSASRSTRSWRRSACSRSSPMTVMAPRCCSASSASSSCWWWAGCGGSASCATAGTSARQR